jgi:Holliday junction resolvase
MGKGRNLVKILTDGSCSPRGEKEICKIFHLNQTPASGAKWHSKSDAYKDDQRIEIKETDKEQLAVKKEWLQKIRKEAAQEGQSPRLLFRIGNEIWVALPAEEHFG